MHVFHCSVVGYSILCVYQIKSVCARSKFKNDYDALVEALLLALIAPTNAKADVATNMAESFAASLSAEDVAKAKKAAKKRFSQVAAIS